MSALRDALKRIGSQVSLMSPLGFWAQKVTTSLEAILEALGVDPAAGGGGAASLELDLLDVKRAGIPQVGVTTGTDIVLNNVIFTRGTGITYDFNTGIFTLSVGKIYELDAGGAVTTFSNGAAGFLDIAWVNADTNAELFPDISGLYKPSTQTEASSNGGRTRALYSPENAAVSRVKLRVIGALGTADIPTEWFGAIVKQLR